MKIGKIKRRKALNFEYLFVFAALFSLNSSSFFKLTFFSDPAAWGAYIFELTSAITALSVFTAEVSALIADLFFINNHPSLNWLELVFILSITL